MKINTSKSYLYKQCPLSLYHENNKDSNKYVRDIENQIPSSLEQSVGNASHFIAEYILKTIGTNIFKMNLRDNPIDMQTYWFDKNECFDLMKAYFSLSLDANLILIIEKLYDKMSMGDISKVMYCVYEYILLIRETLVCSGIKRIAMYVEKKHTVEIGGININIKPDLILLVERKDTVEFRVYDLKTSSLPYMDKNLEVNEQLDYPIYFLSKDYLASYPDNLEHKYIKYIIQPLSYSETIHSTDIEVASLKERTIMEITELKKLQRTIETKENKIPANLGDHCKFCKYKLCCSKLIDSVLPTLCTFDKTDKYVDKLSDDKIHFLLKSRKAVEQLFVELTELIKTRLADGYKIEGFHLYERTIRNDFVDEDQFIAAFYDEYGEDIFKDKKLKNITDLKKLMGDSTVIPFIRPVKSKMLKVK